MLSQFCAQSSSGDMSSLHVILKLPWGQNPNPPIFCSNSFTCRQALIEARPSCPGRKEFVRADLVTWALLAEMGTDLALQVPSVLLLASLLCMHVFCVD